MKAYKKKLKKKNLLMNILNPQMFLMIKATKLNQEQKKVFSRKINSSDIFISELIEIKRIKIISKIEIKMKIRKIKK